MTQEELVRAVPELTLVLEKTPKIEPFRTEVSTAISHLEHGDLSSNPLWKIIHGYVSARAIEGNLPEKDWIVQEVTGGGRIVAHRQFLEIQDKFQELETGEGKKLLWNSEKAVEAFQSYISIAGKYRDRHLRIYQKALQHLGRSEQEKLQQIVSRMFAYLIDPDRNEIVLVAIPSHLDNQNLWEEFSFSEDLLARIPAYAKIHESGVVLASAAHRDDNPNGHDYFSYAARSVIAGQVDEISKKLELTAQHEGSHGITDALLIHLLRIGDRNPVQEGIIGALGDDGRENVFTSLTPKQLIGTDVINFDSKINMDWSYVAGPKLFKALFNILSQMPESMEENVWSRIVAAELNVALSMSESPTTYELKEPERVARFLGNVIAELEIPIEDVEIAYNAMNSKNGRVL